MSRLAQLVERKTLNLVVVGSSPTVGICSSSASPLYYITSSCARLAQSVERKTLNLVVVGSSPTVGVILFLYAKIYQYSPFFTIK